ncbi:ZrgA family zinc uptake protein [Colwellia psychrerythraea]|uniref:Uncharacterized protein n=1 Tax=Colwellia psychrerythraea TaxID=28229 RepID=A0A099KFE8_COLPS|nr:DUF2796 domain-containing protein [Colwellia psychrerythraea]KGJ88353.1 Protein of unknown function DUF2796 [Colwellia psychrerythraea]
MKNNIIAWKQQINHVIKLCVEVGIVLFCSFIHIHSSAKEGAILSTHAHGLSEMNIALENQKLVIELLSPAIDLVGFEHKAKTEKSINKVKKVETKLRKHNDIVSLSGGNCQLISTFIDVSNLTNIPDDHQHHQVHSNKKNNHSEVISKYDYHCEKISELSSITVKVFHLFTSVKEVQAIWITEIHQGAERLNAKNNVINLR